MINAFQKGPWRKDRKETCIEAIPLIGPKLPCAGPNPGGAPWTWTFDPFANNSFGYMGTSLASCFGVQPPQLLGAFEQYQVRPIYVLNHILDNNAAAYAGECSFPDLTKDKDWPGGDKVPKDVHWPPPGQGDGETCSPWQYLCDYMTWRAPLAPPSPIGTPALPTRSPCLL